MLSICEVSNAPWKALAGGEDVPELLILLSELLKRHRWGPERGCHFSKVTQQVNCASQTAYGLLAFPGLPDRKSGTLGFSPDLL